MFRYVQSRSFWKEPGTCTVYKPRICIYVYMYMNTNKCIYTFMYTCIYIYAIYAHFLKPHLRISRFQEFSDQEFDKASPGPHLCFFLCCSDPADEATTPLQRGVPLLSRGAAESGGVAQNCRESLFSRFPKSASKSRFFEISKTATSIHDFSGFPKNPVAFLIQLVKMRGFLVLFVLTNRNTGFRVTYRHRL